MDDANAYFNLLMARSRQAFIIRDEPELYESAKADYQTALSTFTKSLDDYKSILASDPDPDPEDVRLANEIFNMWAEYQPLSASILPSIDEGRDEDARALYSNPALVDLGNKLSDALRNYHKITCSLNGLFSVILRQQNPRVALATHGTSFLV